MNPKEQKLVSVLKSEVNKAISIFKSIPWEESPQYYAQWLAQTFYFASQSTRLLALSSSRLAEAQHHERFIKHASEEIGHDRLLIQDCKSLGYKISDFSELPTTALLYQSQYYWIEHRHPFAFLGYTLFLEKLAADFGPTFFDKLKKHYPSAMKFVLVHAKEDVAHSEDSVRRVQELPQDLQNMIAQNIQQTGLLYCQTLESIRNQTLNSAAA